MAYCRDPGSFRDPSGHVFREDGVLFRQINESYRDEYVTLEESGLYDRLTSKGMLVRHAEVDIQQFTEGVYKIIKPVEAPFISYPYEWSFSQLKDAALLTLDIQNLAIDAGMSLKDASAYNVQFVESRPIFIDTLSFETYHPEKPWIAYRQFCQHFLAPLSLASFTDINLLNLQKSFIDGIPLDLASKLLPAKTYLKFGIALHLHLHAKSQSKFGAKEGVASSAKSFNKNSMRGLIDSLRSTICKLEWKAQGTEWITYYKTNNNYGEENLNNKEKLVQELVREISPKTAWDLGANTGRFSRIAAAEKCFVVSWDIDPACVEENYRQCKAESTTNVLPLALDLANPSPSIGWANRERASFGARAGVELILALGLIHHLVIANNIPLFEVAEYFAQLGKHLILEFVPKEDSQVKKLLSSREDIFSDYTMEGVIHAFSQFYTIEKQNKVADTSRHLIWMKRRG